MTNQPANRFGSLNNENLSGNPNMQLGGLLRPWPVDFDMNFLEEIKEVQSDGRRVLIRCLTNRMEDATVALTPVNSHVLRVTMFPAGLPLEARQTPCLVSGADTSVPFEVTETERTVAIRFGELVCEVNRQPWELVLKNRDGKIICREHRSDTNLRGWRRATWLGYRRDPAGKVAGTYNALYLGADEHIYGLGEKFMNLDRRGQRIESWNFNTWGATNERAYKNVPFFMSTKGYGFFLNTTFKVNWDIGSGATTSLSTQVETEDDRFDCFLIYGPDMPAILQRYTELTGRPPVPPRWSFGYWQSKYGYTSWDEVWSVVNRARELKVPMDVVHLDPYWMRPRLYADLVWDLERFPDPEGNMAKLREQGVRICLWLHPWIPEQSDQFEAGVAAGAFARREDGGIYFYSPTIPGNPPNRAGIIDFTSKSGREWYIQKLVGLIKQGVCAFKTDFGEAIPEDAVFANGMRGKEIHNSYPLLYNEAFYEAFERSGRAGDLVCWGRSGWAGIQRYPVSWSGDMNCNFPSMAVTLWGGLSYSMSGVAFWSHDLGGFSGQTYPELYMRWIQWGLLSSHSRGHGTHEREPWNQGEKALEVFRTYDELRYRLIPYLYSYAHVAHATGLPVMRPLVLEYQDDPNTFPVDLQYLLGSELLVSPVFEEGATERRLYLPEGTWYDFATGKESEGGCWVTVPAPVESIPLFVKAGSILPLGPIEQYVGERGTAELSLLICPLGGQAGFTLYEDGGSTQFSYQDGLLSITPQGEVARERTYRVSVVGRTGETVIQAEGVTTVTL